MTPSKVTKDMSLTDLSNLALDALHDARYAAGNFSAGKISDAIHKAEKSSEMFFQAALAMEAMAGDFSDFQRTNDPYGRSPDFECLEQSVRKHRVWMATQAALLRLLSNGEGE